MLWNHLKLNLNVNESYFFGIFTTKRIQELLVEVLHGYVPVIGLNCTDHWPALPRIENACIGILGMSASCELAGHHLAHKSLTKEVGHTENTKVVDQHIYRLKTPFSFKTPAMWPGPPCVPNSRWKQAACSVSFS